MVFCAKKQGDLGTVYVEFLLVFFPMMLLWLGLAQIGLMYGAHLLVHSAASRAGRAAVVILPDDREGHEDRYGGVPPLQIGGGEGGLDAYDSAPSDGRLHAIRRAARITLAPISPDFGAAAFGAVAGFAAGYLVTDFTVAVTFPKGEGEYASSFPDSTAPLTTKVTYLYRCPVPVVNRLMCRPYYGADSLLSEQTLDTIAGAGIDIPMESGIDGVAAKELETVGGDAVGLLSLGMEIANNLLDGDGMGWRFYPLTAEVTLPLQGKYQ